MELAELTPLGADSLRVKRVRLALEALVVAAILATAAVMVPRWTDWPFPWWLAALVALANLVVSWGWAGLDHSRWGWRLSDDLLEVQRGVVFRRTALVPRSRIQNVTTTVGPLQGRFGVLTLIVHTAGTRTPSVAIQDMDAGHAEGIRRRLGLV